MSAIDPLAMGYLPIASAPQDGRRVYLMHVGPTLNDVWGGTFCWRDGQWFSGPLAAPRSSPPTHWRPRDQVSA